MKRGKLDPQVTSDLLAHLAKGPAASFAPDQALIGSNRSGLALELRSYGEDAVALAVEAAPDQTIWAISKRGGELMFSSGENIPRSLCLAAVELIEGKARPLARKKRRRAT
jgi:hypothetical protein